ncbi:hypothetical protein HYV86_02120 [Candidatus Woesearchaeota archaeon]|nr:hypothetical protein [Candidatus Woesearchaeota archaeon]
MAIIPTPYQAIHTQEQVVDNLRALVEAPVLGNFQFVGDNCIISTNAANLKLGGYKAGFEERFRLHEVHPLAIAYINAIGGEIYLDHATLFLEASPEVLKTRRMRANSSLGLNFQVSRRNPLDASSLFQYGVSTYAPDKKIKTWEEEIRQTLDDLLPHKIFKD